MIFVPPTNDPSVDRKRDDEQETVAVQPQKKRRCCGGGKRPSGKVLINGIAYDHTPFLTNVRAIEHFTGLKFLTNLDDDVQERVKKVTATELWSVD